MPLQIVEKRVGAVTVLELSGRITSGDESVQLRSKLKALLTGKPRLVLDMANVNYIDSTAVGTLLASSTSAANQGGRMVLANLMWGSGSASRFFETFDSVDDAVKSFS